MSLIRLSLLGLTLSLVTDHVVAGEFEVVDETDKITIKTRQLEAVIRKKGYVSGVAGGSFLDKKTGVRDLGFGLDIADWIMEPGSDEAYRSKLEKELIYRFNNLHHGKRPKRSIEGPQICTKAKELNPKLIQGEDFVAVKMSFRYRTAAPGRKTGSTWSQTLVFPKGKRYFVSSDRIDAVNDSPGMFLRIDMPGHIKHNQGDTFRQVYLSYLNQTNSPSGGDGTIPASAFTKNFAPDARFNYRRDVLEAQKMPLPKRFIRAYSIRGKKSQAKGPWLAGMTLDPSIVHEAWCHQRNYICMIEEFGGRPIKAGQSFSAAFIVGYFDSIDEMHRVYDQYKGHTGITVSRKGWRLTR